MMVGERLRALRLAKQFSQGEIEKRTGLLRCYISRVENGHTVPAVETLEKFARALEVPTYQIFYEGDEPPNLPTLSNNGRDKVAWGDSGKNARTLTRFRQLLGRTTEKDRTLLLYIAQKMARRRSAAEL